jgi:hypothetical protein
MLGIDHRAQDYFDFGIDSPYYWKAITHSRLQAYSYGMCKIVNGISQPLTCFVSPTKKFVKAVNKPS